LGRNGAPFETASADPATTDPYGAVNQRFADWL
jgi:hypothetical protein